MLPPLGRPGLTSTPALPALLRDALFARKSYISSMQRNIPFSVRDLLYLDFDKAASIWSQFEEGLLERISETEDSGKDRTAGTKFGIPKLAEASLGVEYQN